MKRFSTSPEADGYGSHYRRLARVHPLSLATGVLEKKSRNVHVPGAR